MEPTGVVISVSYALRTLERGGSLHAHVFAATPTPRALDGRTVC